MPTPPNFPQMEEDVLKLWEQEDVFKKTLEKPSPEGDFVFYEGPPTANGMPGIHHVEARAFKDIIPRYKTMRGFHVPRQAGWDTHGLPVELEVEKRLGISGKPQIESLKSTPEESIAYFNDECKKSVWKYLDAWVKMTRRIGFWLDLDHPYITYETGYIAKLWGIIKKISDRGLLYKDYKVVPFCPRCGTALSSHELAQGYDEAEDPSVYVRFKIKQFYGLDHRTVGETFLLVWTTTPWTLPGNVALAVKEDAEYVAVKQKPTVIANEVKQSSSESGLLRRSAPRNDGVLSPTPRNDGVLSPTPRNDGVLSPTPRNDELFILAKARLDVLDGEYEIIREFKGRDLVGLEYEPLYNFVAYDKKAHYVTSADFVSLDDGTGIVHTAVMYGVDDFELGEKIGLPKKHVVGPDGKFLPEVTPWAGVFVKDADPLIIKELDSRELLYRQETVKHTYPFCWRCDTPLIYYARDSWFIRMSKLRDKLIKENQKINWVPEHIKEGRFGEWLREVKDWAFSRERYWGTPLPVWVCTCGEQKIVGGLDEFPETGRGNRFFILRHGKRTGIGMASSRLDADYHLTDEGKQQIESAAKQLRKIGVDMVFTSDYPRTLETAAIIEQEAGIAPVSDVRLRELQLGEWAEQPESEFFGRFAGGDVERFSNPPPGGETLTDAANRILNLIRELDAKHTEKTILLVGHGDPFWAFEGSYRGMNPRQIVAQKKELYPNMGELRELPPLRTFPRGADGFVDLHRPYIDAVTFPCPTCGKTMTRTKEVCDVWFDSGSMPFAAYPSLTSLPQGEGNRNDIPLPGGERLGKGALYPADYIAEAIDQTRGWFYTLLAVGTLMEKGTPYKNVICLGLLLDVNGQKMSKSRGNVVDPMAMIEKYGADAVRWFMYTVNQPGDTKRFDERDVDQIVKKVFLILWNVLAFLKTYQDSSLRGAPHMYVGGDEAIHDSAGLLRSARNDSEMHLLDRWILARLSELVQTTTTNLDSYRITEAGRAIADFITDLSTWYVRRSRERMKTGDGVAVLRDVLDVLARLLAPFAPFLAESLWRELGHTTSVHLAEWPISSVIARSKTTKQSSILSDMDLVRRIASLAHEQRAAAKIPVRQPLATLTVRGSNLSRGNDNQELVQILKDETNVRNIVIARSPRGNEAIQSLAVELDLALTPELKREGLLREIVRAVNDLRKQAKLTVADRIILRYDTSDNAMRDVFTSEADKLTAAVRADRIESGKKKSDAEAELSNLWLGISKQPSLRTK